jgi:hypothetical protein
MKLVSQYLENIKELQVFSIISLLIFFFLLVLLIFYVLRLTKENINSMKNIPLDDGTMPHEEST